jgi:hypothetical protein
MKPQHASVAALEQNIGAGKQKLPDWRVEARPPARLVAASRPDEEPTRNRPIQDRCSLH